MKQRSCIAAVLAVAFAFSGCSGPQSLSAIPMSASGHHRHRFRPRTVISNSCNTLPGQVAGTITEYSLPRASAQPIGIAVDAQSNVWVAEYNTARIAEFVPGTSSWSEVVTPTSNSEPRDVAIGPDGNAWFTEYNAAKVGVVRAGVVSEYGFAGQAFGIDSNPDGNLYAGAPTDYVAKISTGGTVTKTATSNSPWEVSSDSSGNVWYTTNDGPQGADKVVERKADGTAATYNVPTANSQPYGITEGPGSTGMWFTEVSGNKIGNITPGGQIVEYRVPTAGSNPVGIVAACGKLWFTEKQADQIGELDPSTGTFTEYPVPTSGGGPNRVAIDQNGNVWFSESDSDKIAMIATSTAPGACNPVPGQVVGTVTEYPMPRASAQPLGIGVDAQANVWVAEYGAARIAEFVPGTSSWSEYATLTSNSEPRDIAIGPDGNAWFTEYNAAKVGVVRGTTVSEYGFASRAFGITSNTNGNLYAGAPTDYIATITTGGTVTKTATSHSAWEVSSDASGNVWYTTNDGPQGANTVVARNADGSFGVYNVPTPSSKPYGIAPGPGSTGMWFTEVAGNKIGNVTPGGQIVEYPVPTAASSPVGIVAACGKLWFTEKNADQIGELDPNSGSFVEYPIPTPSAGPNRITVDQNGNAWFTESDSDKIAMIATSTAFGPGARRAPRRSRASVTKRPPAI